MPYNINDEMRVVRDALISAIENSNVKDIATILDQIPDPRKVVNQFRLAPLSYSDFQSLADLVKTESAQQYVLISLAAKLQRSVGMLPAGESLSEDEWESIFNTYKILLSKLQKSMDAETARAAQKIKDEYLKTHTGARLESPPIISRDVLSTVNFYNRLNKCFGGQKIIVKPKTLEDRIDSDSDRFQTILMEMRKTIRETIFKYFENKVDILVNDFLQRTFTGATPVVVSGAFSEMQDFIRTLKTDLSENFHIDNIGSITMSQVHFMPGNVDISESGLFKNLPHGYPRDREYIAQMDVSYKGYKTKFTFKPEASCKEILDAFDKFITKIFDMFIKEYGKEIYVKLYSYGKKHGILLRRDDFVPNEPSRIRSFESIMHEAVLGLGDLQVSIDSARSIIDRLNRFNRYIPSLDAQVAITNYPVFMAELVNFVNKNDLHKYLPENSILKNRGDSAFWALPTFYPESDENESEIAKEYLQKATEELIQGLENYQAMEKRHIGETPLDTFIRDPKSYSDDQPSSEDVDE